MVEDRDTGWVVVFEKKGMYQTVDILENYGIDSDTDVSVIDQDNFNKLVSPRLRSLDTKGRLLRLREDYSDMDLEIESHLLQSIDYLFHLLQ
jgi:hypothetical protein